MGIPLPSLAINAQQPNPLETYGKALSIKGLLQNQEFQQQQQPQLLQQQAQENEMRQMQINDQKTLRSLSSQHVQKDENGKVTGFDFDGLMKDASAAGVSPQTLTQIGEGRAKMLQSYLSLDENTRKSMNEKQTDFYNGLESLRSIKDPAKRQAALPGLLQTLQGKGVDTSKIPPNAPVDDATLDNFESVMGMHAQIANDAKLSSEVNEKNQQTATAKANQAHLEMETAQGGTPEARELNSYLVNHPGKTPEDFIKFKAQNSPSVIVQNQGTGAAADPMVDMVGQNRIDLPTVLQRMQPGPKAAFLAQLSAKYPEYYQGAFGIEKKVGEQFTSGTYSQQLNAINTAREHMKTFTQMADALGNTDTQVVNKAKQAWQTQFGSEAPTNFLIAKDAFSGEVGKALAGAGVTQGDRNKVEEAINQSESPAQLKGAAQTADALLAGKQTALKSTYEQGRQGKPNFGDKNPAGPKKPESATHTGVGSVDKKKHWLDAQGNDLGVAE